MVHEQPFLFDNAGHIRVECVFLTIKRLGEAVTGLGGVDNGYQLIGREHCAPP